MKNFLKFKTRENSQDSRAASCQRDFSDEQYMLEARMWRPFRHMGVFGALTAVVFNLFGLIDGQWLEGTYMGKEVQFGVWENCYQNVTENALQGHCIDGDGPRPHWQNAVISLLVFSLGLGSMATILSIFGVFAKHLPKKVYYYHSAGEIYFICALSATSALIAYPIALYGLEGAARYQLGLGYGLGWGCCFFFLAAAICMSLDDLVRCVTKVLPKKCKRRNSRDDLDHV